MAGYNFNNITVLVVEDNPHMRRLIKEILLSFGCTRVREASDGGDAFDILRNTPIDIIVTDWMMEPIDGIEFLKILRTSRDSPNPFVPVIMLTGHTERHRIIEARDCGVTEFLSKPVSAAKLYYRFVEIIEHPRQFIKAPRYVGPDRRRKAVPYDGPARRIADKQENLVENGVSSGVGGKRKAG